MAIDRYSYPFTAIVGQDEMKLALVLNAINPTIGGVLIRGEKGTGKSTAVRALARLLPDQQVVEGCHFGCHPDDPEDWCLDCRERAAAGALRSEEHTSELQSRGHLVCRLLLEKKKNTPPKLPSPSS